MKKSITVFNGSRLLMALAALSMTLQFSACTSGGEQNDVEAVQDVEGMGGEEVAQEDEALLSDSLPEDALGTDTEMMTALDEGTAPAPTDVNLDDSAIGEETDIASLEENNSTLDDLSSLDSTPATETTSSYDNSSADLATTDSMASEPAEEPAPRANIPLQKVASTPWKVSGKWVNGIYFARPGDTLQSISSTLYGEDRTDELAKINPTYQRREPRPGDKVYYASSRRPDDNAQILTWYEENGIAPQIYVTKDGENIRTVAKNLLGFDGAWKEVWSTNSVESKGAVDGGEELRYWPSAPVPTQTLADNSNNMEQGPAGGMQMPPAPEEQPMDQMANNEFNPSAEPPPMDMAQNDMLPPPSMDESNDLPPPPQDPMMAMNDSELPPPPPPPMEEMAPPPPPPTSSSMTSETQEMDEDTMMALGTIALAAVGVAALLVVRRRRRQKELENQFDSTHVGT